MENVMSKEIQIKKILADPIKTPVPVDPKELYKVCNDIHICFLDGDSKY